MTHDSFGVSKRTVDLTGSTPLERHATASTDRTDRTDSSTDDSPQDGQRTPSPSDGTASPSVDGSDRRDASRATQHTSGASHHSHQRSLPRVAFFIPTMNSGGAEVVTATIANGLAERGYAVDLVLARRVGPVLDRVDSAVTVVDLETPSVPGVGILASIPALSRYLRRERPDVLFAAMMNANVVSVLTSAITDVDTRVVLTEHNTFAVRVNPSLRERVSAGLASVLYPRADHVVGVSRGVADSVVAGTRVDADHVSVLYNPIDVDAIREAAAKPLDAEAAARMDGDVIFTVGRLEAAKNHAMLLRAFRRVHEERPAVRLVIAGSGSKRDDIEQLAADLGLSDAVDLVGYVEDAYPYIAAASVFALSSRHEGLPTTLLEALACETPIVSTDCPSGPREILADGRYGALVPVDDDRAFAEALLETLDAPTPAAALGTRAEDFSLEAVLSEYESFIGRVTGAP